MLTSPPRWFSFKSWCAAKGFTVQHGYQLIRDGFLNTVKSGNRRYVTEDEDRRFDEASAVGPEEMQAPPQLRKAAEAGG